MTTVLDWAEKAGIENMKSHVNNADLILKQASTLLTLLLSGAGAALYFGMSHNELRLVAITISLWLFGLATILTLKCLMFDDFPSIWNEPQNLNIKGYSLERLRQYELENLQTRIKKAIFINSKKSKRLNNCIFAACATPIVGAVSWFVSVFHFCA